MQSHQLAVLREKLNNLTLKLRNKNHPNMRAQIEGQIKQVRGQIANLGANGILKMAIVVVKFAYSVHDQHTGFYGLDCGNRTESYMFWDLDDESIYALLTHYLKNGEEYLSRSIVEVPLKRPIPSSLKDNMISWQIL